MKDKVGRFGSLYRRSCKYYMILYIETILIKMSSF